MPSINDKELAELRKQVDVIDKEVLRLLENRYDLIREIVKLKKRKKLPARDIEREAEIIRHKCKLTHLPPAFIEKIYRDIIDHAIEMQER